MYLAMLSIVALAACGDSGQLLAPTPSTAPTLRAAAAQTETESYFTPTVFSRYVPCANGGAGEVVDVTGTVHRVFHVTENANGFHITLHANPQRVVGTGRRTGDTYQARGIFTLHQNVVAGATETIHDTFQLVGQGPDNNLTLRQTSHITINANGELTVVNQDFSLECS
jgi:hypothetical protein